jgi:hypothetical protein
MKKIVIKVAFRGAKFYSPGNRGLKNGQELKKRVPHDIPNCYCFCINSLPRVQDSFNFRNCRLAVTLLFFLAVL